MFVRGIVIDNEMDGQVVWHLGLNVAQKRQEFLMPVPPPTLTEHRAGGDVQGSEQSRGAMTHVVVRHPFDISQPQREDGLRAIQGLDMGVEPKRLPHAMDGGFGDCSGGIVRDRRIHHPDLWAAYCTCVDLLAQFRDIHVGYADSYIQRQHQAHVSNPTAVGTGGTPFMA